MHRRELRAWPALNLIEANHRSLRLHTSGSTRPHTIRRHCHAYRECPNQFQGDCRRENARWHRFARRTHRSSNLLALLRARF
jgi:hypothetical protein